MRRCGAPLWHSGPGGRLCTLDGALQVDIAPCVRLPSSAVSVAFRALAQSGGSFGRVQRACNLCRGSTLQRSAACLCWKSGMLVATALVRPLHGWCGHVASLHTRPPLIVMWQVCRRESNKESARRSRARKLEEIHTLKQQARLCAVALIVDAAAPRVHATTTRRSLALCFLQPEARQDCIT